LIGGGSVCHGPYETSVTYKEVDDSGQTFACGGIEVAGCVHTPSLGERVQPAPDVLEQLQDQPRDVVEVAIEGGSRERGLGHHQVNRQLAIRALAEQPVSRGEDLTARVLSLFAATHAEGRGTHRAD